MKHNFRANYLENDLSRIVKGKHKSKACRNQCQRNAEIFRHEPFDCNYNNETSKAILDHRIVPVPKHLEKVWNDDNLNSIAEGDFLSVRLEELKKDVNYGRRPTADLNAFQSKNKDL